MLTIVKILLSALLIYFVNEIVVARSKPVIGSLIASLPLVSLITFFWIWRDLTVKGTEDRVRILSDHSTNVFWFVLPSLPLFLVFPALLKRGLSFGWAIGLSCVLTMVLYLLTALVLRKFGITI